MTPARVTSSRHSSTSGLTPRQLTAAQLAAEGLRVVDIADKMDVAPNTVKTHLLAAYRQLGVHNRVELTHRLVRLGLLASSGHGQEEPPSPEEAGGAPGEPAGADA